MLSLIGRLWDRLRVRRNSLVGRLIRLASLWFIFSLVITGIALTAYFHETALQRFQLGVGEIADELFTDTDIADNGEVITPSFLDPRANNLNSGLYWQVSEVTSNGIVDQAKSRSLWNARLGLPVDILNQARGAKNGKIFDYDTFGQQNEPVRAAVIYSKIDKRAFVFIAAEDRRQMDKDVRTFALVTALALIILAIGSLLAIFFQVRIGLRPLFDLTGEVAGIQRGEQQRLMKTYPAEMVPVAKQINAFLDDAQELSLIHI